MKLPKALRPHVAGRSYTLDRVGRSGSTIALCLRSLRDNARGRFGTVYPGFDGELLLRRLGIAPDREKIRYYLLLDELF